MKYELAGVKNGVELYNPVHENRSEEIELEARMTRCANILYEMILKYYDEIEPELILDKKGHFRFYQAEKAHHVSWRIKGKIANDICTTVILADFVSRGREKGQQNLVFRMFPAETFHQGTSLLKFAQTGCMEPHISGVRIYLMSQDTKRVPMPPHHLSCLLVKRRHQNNGQHIQINT